MEAYEKEDRLDEMMAWVKEQISYGKIPRLSDVVYYAKVTRGWTELNKKDIARRLRLSQNYLMSWQQQRPRSRNTKSRVINTNSLGHLHCDIAFYSRSKDYETPVTFRSGFLVAKDVLSRFLYAVPLKKTKSADSLIAAFKILFQQHEAHFGKEGHKITSVSFDQEPGILSDKVQTFFKENNVSFFKFQFSSSKAKMAEGAIKIIRKNMAIFVTDRDDKRWWRNLSTIVDGLNSRELVIDKKRLGYSPAQINSTNLEQFLKVLHKKVPKYYWSQFAVDSSLVKFKFKLDDLVRPKLVVTSSAVLGQKRSEVSLSTEVFVIKERGAYVSGGFNIVNYYKCQQLSNPNHFENFDEGDIALTSK